MLPVLVLVAAVLGIWLGSKWWFGDDFADPFKYPAKAASLSATVLMCISFILSTRMRFLEDIFGGLDKVYQVHKRLGRLAFFIIPIHPICLAAHELPDPLAFLAGMFFQNSWEPYYIGHNIGIFAFLLMAGLSIVTLRRRMAYHCWKISHEWFGLVLLLVVAHIYYVDADIAAYPLLGAIMYGLLFAAVAAFVYIRFFYERFGPRHPFLVDHTERIGDILELTFAPADAIMDFKPSQFVYLVVRKEGISPEPHPYSIANGYNLAGNFKLGIKEVGDHTSRLSALAPDDNVDVYGPYGRFSDRFLTAERNCIFIGGGIGITPFIGMWHTALHSEERLEEGEVSSELRHMHPEIIKTWKSPRVALFYIVRHAVEASFDDDIRREVVLSKYHGFKALEERGHHYELYLSGVKGRITADYIAGVVGEGFQNRNIFFCGPTPMVDALSKQFRQLGVGRDQIIVEDFNLV